MAKGKYVRVVKSDLIRKDKFENENSISYKIEILNQETDLNSNLKISNYDNLKPYKISKR